MSKRVGHGRQQAQGRGGAGQRMLGRYGEHQRLFAQHLALDARVVQPQAAKAHVDPSGVERLVLLDRQFFHQHQFGLRLDGAKQPGNARQRAVHGGGHKADHQPPLHLGDAPRHGDGLVDLLQQAHGTRIKKASRFGQPQRPGIAFQQFHADLVFELLDLPAQRRLRDVQPLRCPGEAALFCHGHEILEVSKIHGMPFRYGVSPKRSLKSGRLYSKIAPRIKKTDLAEVPPDRLPSRRCQPATPGLKQLPKVLSPKERETSKKEI